MNARNQSAVITLSETTGKLLLVACTCMFAVSAWAQQPSIFLNTSPTSTEIELEPGTDVAIDPLTGNLFATPADPAACSATVSCDDVEVDVISFNASPATVQQGQNVNFNWNSRGAWSCAGSGFASTAWNATGKLPSGSQAVSTTGVAFGTYDVVLNCSNGPVSDQLIRSVTVEENSGGGFCADEGRLPPPGIFRDNTIAFNQFSGLPTSDITLLWSQFFELDFPAGQTRYSAITKNTYAALEFDSGALSSNRFGNVRLNAPGAFFDTGEGIMTISECPGDFIGGSDTDCVENFGGLGRVDWSVDNRTGTCKINPDTTYYLNILYTQNDNPPFIWSCSSAPNPATAPYCVHILNPSSN